MLVREGPEHVDIAEYDAVQGVVEHHVQPLEGTHGSNFRHTEARAVIDKPHVAPQFLSYLVEGFAHDAEILLRGVSAAEALGGGTVGNIIQQALGRGADDGDNLGSLQCRSLRLNDVFIYIACGDDAVKVGNFLLIQVTDEAGPFLPVLPYFLYRCLNEREKIFLPSFHMGRRPDFFVCHELCSLLRCKPAPRHQAAKGPGYA